MYEALSLGLQRYKSLSQQQALSPSAKFFLNLEYILAPIRDILQDQTRPLKKKLIQLAVFSRRYHDCLTNETDAALMGRHRTNFEFFNSLVDERSRDLAASITKSDLKDMRKIIVRSMEDNEIRINIEDQWSEWSFTVEEAGIVNPIFAEKALEVAKASFFWSKILPKC